MWWMIVILFVCLFVNKSMTFHFIWTNLITIVHPFFCCLTYWMNSINLLNDNERKKQTFWYPSIMFWKRIRWSIKKSKNRMQKKFKFFFYRKNVLFRHLRMINTIDQQLWRCNIHNIYNMNFWINFVVVVVSHTEKNLCVFNEENWLWSIFRMIKKKIDHYYYYRENKPLFSSSS